MWIRTHGVEAEYWIGSYGGIIETSGKYTNESWCIYASFQLIICINCSYLFTQNAVFQTAHLYMAPKVNKCNKTPQVRHICPSLVFPHNHDLSFFLL